MLRHAKYVLNRSVAFDSVNSSLKMLSDYFGDFSLLQCSVGACSGWLLARTRFFTRRTSGSQNRVSRLCTLQQKETLIAEIDSFIL